MPIKGILFSESDWKERGWKNLKIKKNTNKLKDITVNDKKGHRNGLRKAE